MVSTALPLKPFSAKLVEKGLFRVPYLRILKFIFAADF
jgi:hypothetical protein